MRVCFFIWALRAAGAERVLSSLANAWSAKGWEVCILAMEDGQVPPFYPLSPAVEVRYLDLLKDSSGPWSGLANNLRRLSTIRKAIREARPDVLVSFIDKANALSVIASRGLGVPIVISERTDPSRRTLGRFWNKLRDLAYPRADVVVFQSQAVLDWFPARVRAKGLVIPNAVSLPPPAASSPASGAPRRVLAMGRLHAVKGFDLLLPAFAAASARVPGWELDIWGEGAELGALEAQAQDLGLGGSVRFRGVTDAPFDAMRQADLFVMSSRAEGFPNALVEAMACGMPVLTTDFGGAAKEIVHDGVDGLVVPPGKAEALAEGLTRLMSDAELRARLAAQAPDVARRFAPERVIALWEGALERASAARRPGPRALETSGVGRRAEP